MNAFQSFLAEVRERVKSHLFDNKNLIQVFFLYSSLLVSVLAIIILILGFGYTLSVQQHYWFNISFVIALTFYVVRFLFNITYSMDRKNYMKGNYFEFGLVIIYLVILFNYLFLGTWIEQKVGLILDEGDFGHVLRTGVRIFFLLFAANDIARYSELLSKLRIGTSGLLILSFIILIFSGAGILCMPNMTNGGIRFLDALFTSTSAACVTGLAVVDISEVFTTKGHFIIMLLIQFGGWNIITFAAFFSTFLWDSSGIKYQSILHDVVSTNSMSETKTMLRKIIYYSLAIEFVGAVMMFIYWYSIGFFDSTQQNIFYSVFHAVSAFNNAGLTLWSQGLVDPALRYSYFIQSIIMILIFLGGIGFFVLQEMTSRRRNIRGHRFSLSSSIALRTSFILIIIGASLFFVLEANNSMTFTSTFDKAWVSLFQSVSSRTAGFNSIDLSQLNNPTLFVLIALMFVGASPASTGGGIKTTTFFVLITTAFSVIRSSKHVTYGKNTISYVVVNKAFTLFFFAVLLICLSTFALSVTEENMQFIDILFEEVSAFGTVGLSTGITAQLSDVGRIIIIITMFLGRVGLLTIGVALARHVFSDYKYPDVKILVG